tara:strand:- start:201 stop:1553 length:1353 start_codon:yes stop_codon:yes gene_type:complete
MGAYTNPKLYGLDFSVITENTSEAAAKIAYATAKQQEERSKREKEFKDSYKDFISKAYLDANDYLGEEYRNTLNDSLQDIENFANMSEADKQNHIRNVKATNAGMKEIATKMPELATMDIDIDRYDDPSVRLLGAMARGDRSAFKSVKDPNNPMVINWQYTEKDPDTGESKTYDISMKDLRMSMGSVQDISPRIDAIDNELSALAGQYQKNINSFATRGARFDWENKFSEYFKGMDEEELDLYYRNAFPDIRGVDYTPNINPATNQPWGDSDEEQAEREKLYNEKRQDLEARLKQKITGLLADTPLAMTEREKLDAAEARSRRTARYKQSLEDLEKTKDFDQDLFDTISEIADEVKSFRIPQILPPQANFLIGKQVKIQGENKTIIDVSVKDGLLVVDYEGPYVGKERENPIMKQKFSLDRPDDLYLAITGAQGVLQKPAQATSKKLMFN